MTNDPRVPDLQGGAILTDTQIRLTFAPARAESRVLAAQIAVPKSRIDDMQPMVQQGQVHIQLKAGFGPSRRLVLTAAEVFLLQDALDRFITELPQVDTEVGR